VKKTDKSKVLALRELTNNLGWVHLHSLLTTKEHERAHARLVRLASKHGFKLVNGDWVKK
jgi:hypothetical protein